MSVSQIWKENTASTKLQRTGYDHLAWAQAYSCEQPNAGRTRQGNDCGGGDGGGSVYSKYRSTARNYYNGLYTSINKFSCNQTLHPVHPWSEREA